MKMSYLSCVVTLLSAAPLAVVASSWDQSQNNLTLSGTLATNSNLFNTSANAVSSSRTQLALEWDWRQLYEGYALALPLSVARLHYNTALIDDTTLYQADPTLRFFLSESTDLSVETAFSRRQVLRGDDAAEFLAADEPVLQAESRQAQLVLQVGRAPDIQNIQFRLGKTIEDRETGSRTLASLDSALAELRYQHKLNENIAVVLDAGRRQEQQAGLATDVNQAGAGLALAWTGHQQLQLIVGRFSRSYQQADDVTGSYWQLSNQWQLNQQWQLQLSSSRQSVLSYALDSISQLDTRHQLQLQWTPVQQHQLAFSVSQLRSQLDQRLYQRTRTLLGLRWQWQLNEHWQASLFTERLTQKLAFDEQRDRTEVSARLSWLW